MPPGRSRCSRAGAGTSCQQASGPCSRGDARPRGAQRAAMDPGDVRALASPAAGGAMAKPTTGRVEHAPEPDPDQMATDTLMTSVFSGICLIVATVVLGIFGGSLGLAAGRATDDPTWAKVGFGVGPRPRHGRHRVGAAPVRRSDPGTQHQPLPRGLDRVRRGAGDHRPDGLPAAGGLPAVLPTRADLRQRPAPDLAAPTPGGGARVSPSAGWRPACRRPRGRPAAPGRAGSRRSRSPRCPGDAGDPR